MAAYVAYLWGAPIDLTLLAGLLNGTVPPAMPTIALLCIAVHCWQSKSLPLWVMAFICIFF